MGLESSTPYAPKSISSGQSEPLGIKNFRDEAEKKINVKTASVENNKQHIETLQNKHDRIDVDISMISRQLASTESLLVNNQKKLASCKFTDFGQKNASKEKIKKFAGESVNLRRIIKENGDVKRKIASKMSLLSANSSVETAEIELLKNQIKDIDGMSKSITSEAESEAKVLDSLFDKADKSDSTSAKISYNECLDIHSKIEDANVKLLESKIATSSKQIDLTVADMKIDNVSSEIEALNGAISHSTVNMLQNKAFLTTLKKSDPAFAITQQKIDHFEDRLSSLSNELTVKIEVLSRLNENRSNLNIEMKQLANEESEITAHIDDCKSKLSIKKLELDEAVKAADLAKLEKNSENTASSVSSVIKSIFGIFS